MGSTALYFLVSRDHLAFLVPFYPVNYCKTCRFFQGDWLVPPLLQCFSNQCETH